MIAFPTGVRVWLATGHTDMRKGFSTLALLVQERLKTDPHGGHLFVFRGRRGDLIRRDLRPPGSRPHAQAAIRPPIARHEQGPADAQLREHRGKLAQTPTDDHEGRCSRA